MTATDTRLGKVTLLGGTGFVGTQLTVDLAKHCKNITVLTRHKQRHRDLRILSNVHIEQVDVHDQAQLQDAIAGSDAVINLIGILNQSGSSTNSFQGAHAGLTQKLVACVNHCEIPNLVQMSSLGADAEGGSSEYLRSKGLAEQHIREHLNQGTRVSILRPSVIFGSGDSFFNRFAGLLQAMPVFPLACPDAKMSPVYVGDLSDVVLACLGIEVGVKPDNGTGQHDHIQSYDLCGPKDYTLRELVEFTAETMGLKRKIIGLPDWAARLQGKILGVLPASPFSTDNYLSLQTDSICDNPECRLPTSINAVVPRYIGDKDKRDLEQGYRRFARR